MTDVAPQQIYPGRVSEARRQGNFAEAAALLDVALSQLPNHPAWLIERVMFGLQTNSDDIVVDSIHRLLPAAGSDALQRVLSLATTTLYNRAHPPRYVNIGGGPNFAHPQWCNLDGAPGLSNPVPTPLTTETVFPLPDASVEIVYSSHFLEHIDDATVDRMLSEARRVLNPTGFLVLKLPDFERGIKQFQAGDASFFNAHDWGLDPIIPTWSRKGVVNNAYARTAMVFCGFWNDEYGDHFSHRVESAADAYHGPPAAPEAFMVETLALDSPHEIARRFVQYVEETEPSMHFNHRNAWSRAEFTTVLARAGFTLLSTDETTIVERFAPVIPTLFEMREISMYIVAATA